MERGSESECASARLGFSCRSVWRHVHPELRAASGPLHVRTPAAWQEPVSLPRGIRHPLSDFLCRLLQKRRGLQAKACACECTHKTQFLISINSQIVSITLANDEMYKLCLWSGP